MWGFLGLLAIVLLWLVAWALGKAAKAIAASRKPEGDHDWIFWITSLGVFCLPFADIVPGYIRASRLAEHEGAPRIYRHASVAGYQIADSCLNCWIYLFRPYGYQFVEADVRSPSFDPIAKAPGLWQFYLADSSDSNCVTFPEGGSRPKNTAKYPLSSGRCVAAKLVDTFQSEYLDEYRRQIDRGWGVSGNQHRIAVRSTDETIAESWTLIVFRPWISHLLGFPEWVFSGVDFKARDVLIPTMDKDDNQ